RARQHDEDVAGMWVGVKVTGVGYLLEVRVRELLGERSEVVLDAADRGNLVDLDAFDPLGGENAVRRVRVDDARNQNMRELGQGFPEGRGIPGLSAVIELVDQRALHLLDDADEIYSAASGSVLGEKCRQLAE